MLRWAAERVYCVSASKAVLFDGDGRRERNDVRSEKSSVQPPTASAGETMKLP
jgi:hypothetical protein